MSARLVRIKVLVALVGVAALASCGGQDSNEAPAGQAAAPVPAPSPPAPSPSPTPGSTYSVSLSWSTPSLNTDGTSLTDVSGYQVSYGASSSNLDREQTVTGANATSATVNGLTAGTYYFAVKTLSSAGIVSGASTVVSRSVP